MWDDDDLFRFIYVTIKPNKVRKNIESCVPSLQVATSGTD